MKGWKSGLFVNCCKFPSSCGTVRIRIQESKFNADPDPQHVDSLNISCRLRKTFSANIGERFSNYQYKALHVCVSADEDEGREGCGGVGVLELLCISVADPAFRFEADPDPTLHFDADPDPIFHFDADPDPSFHFDADSDPAFNSDADPASQTDRIWIHNTAILV